MWTRKQTWGYNRIDDKKAGADMMRGQHSRIEQDRTEYEDMTGHEKRTGQDKKPRKGQDMTEDKTRQRTRNHSTRNHSTRNHSTRNHRTRNHRTGT